MSSLIRRIQCYPPLALALLCAAFLFFTHPWGILKFLSVNSDNHLWGFDYFGLPRCGIALLKGVQIAGSEKVVAYGPWSTDWASHPMMCLVLGIPLSRFSDPKFSYFAANFIYFCIHLFALISLSRPMCDGSFHSLSKPNKSKHYLFAFLTGFFVPFVIIYQFGQYHALTVLALTLLLREQPHTKSALILSAFSKPLLAPAGLLLLIQRQWKNIFWIIFILTLGTLPWYVMDSLTGRQSMTELGDAGLRKLKFTVFNWEQEQSVAKLFESFLSPTLNLQIRLGLGTLQMISASFIAWKGDFRTALGLSCLVFFTVYARGHEYHAVTLIPFFIYLFSTNKKPYRSWVFLGIVALFSLPTTYPLLHYGLGSERRPISAFIETSPALGWAFVIQRPLAVMSLWLFVVFVEIEKQTKKSLIDLLTRSRRKVKPIKSQQFSNEQSSQ